MPLRRTSMVGEHFPNRVLWYGLMFLIGCSGPRAMEPASTPRFSVLVFSKTAGFRHASIEAGVAAVEALGAAHGFDVEATEDAGTFTADRLAQYDAVVFLNTTGDVLDADQQSAFEGYIRAGGGYAGIHAAADTEYEWPWYNGLVGAYFKQHPAVQPAEVFVLDRAHPSTRSLPARWSRTDEWYDYQANPRGAVHVLATLGEATYEGGQMGPDHPIAWAHRYDGGRAWYTGMGHTEESYADSLYLEHLLGGIRWAAGAVEGDAGATVAGSYEKVVLDEDTTYPMELDIAEDGRVFFIERDGSLKFWDPETESTHMAGFIPVTTKIEDGLLGLALDPDFTRNQWLYLYYSPLDERPNRLSRFTMDGDALDMTSEVVMLEVPVQRLRCCHSAGSIEFGPGGTLYLSTGENAGSWNRTGDYEEGLYGWDAYWDNERSTANTNDLRGKILRIHPEPDGSYTIPAGNLFEDDDLRTRPEIYTMGHRNPFRFDVDLQTGWVYWGDVGPGNQENEERAPAGYEEINQAKGPGFFGWPYFVGANEPYRDMDPVTRELGAWADPAAPFNDSPNNTGIQRLPPAQPAMIWYYFTPVDAFPELGAGGMSAAAGPIYRYDAQKVGPHGLPPYFDGSVFIYEFMRNWIMEVKLDDDGNLMEINPLFSDLSFIRPIDLELGPDGRLYVLEWGTDFWGQSRDGKLARIDYYGSPERPRPPETAMDEPPSTAAGASPEVSIVAPLDGGFFDYGTPIAYQVRVEGQAASPAEAEVQVQPFLGHDTHTHPLRTERGAEGQFYVMPDPSHAPYIVDHFVELEARFTPQGETVPTVRDTIRLHPRRMEAEHYTRVEGARLVITNNRQRPTFVDETEVFVELGNGDAISFEALNLTGIDSLVLRMVPEASGSVEVRLDALDGQLLAERRFEPPPDSGLVASAAPEGEPPPGEGAPRFRIVRVTGWTEVALPIAVPGGKHALYFVFRGPDSGTVAKFDRVDFMGL